MARADISYDYEDFGKSQGELEAKYGTSGHPEYTLFKWQELLRAHPETEGQYNGYWDWVMQHIAADDDAIEGAPVQEPATATVMIDNIDDFARATATWHANRVARLKNMLETPTGTEVTLDLGNGPETLALEGRLQKGFKMGLIVALNEFGELPFMAEPDDEASAGSDAATGAPNDPAP